jgi:hypothetical protein
MAVLLRLSTDWLCVSMKDYRRFIVSVAIAIGNANRIKFMTRLRLLRLNFPSNIAMHRFSGKPPDRDAVNRAPLGSLTVWKILSAILAAARAFPAAVADC